jgi:hypothetical protein
MGGMQAITAALVMLAVAVPTDARTISVTLTIPDAHGTLGQPVGSGIPFTAPSITFSASADESAVEEPTPGFIRLSIQRHKCMRRVLDSMASSR